MNLPIQLVSILCFRLWEGMLNQALWAPSAKLGKVS